MYTLKFVLLKLMSKSENKIKQYQLNIDANFILKLKKVPLLASHYFFKAQWDIYNVALTKNLVIYNKSVFCI